MSKILAINGSYRDGGVTDQIVEGMATAIREAGAEIEVVLLRDYPIGFCLNCRECTQQPGETPGKCVQHDAMSELIDKIERADGYIFASPTNFGSVTAVFKRFMERLIVYAYWPWEMNAPQFRRANRPEKKAVLASSCAAPGILGRLFLCTRKQLKMTAATVNAKSVGTMFIGLTGKDAHPKLPENTLKKAGMLATKLL